MIPDATNPRATLPLAFVSPGESAELVEIRLGRYELQRLQALGLLPGVLLRVIQSDPVRGLIVSVRRDGRLALDRATAQKLLVTLGECA